MQCVEWAFDLSSCYPWSTWRRSRCFRSMGRLQLNQAVGVLFAQPCTVQGPHHPLWSQIGAALAECFVIRGGRSHHSVPHSFRNSDMGCIVMFRSDIRWLCGGESSRPFQHSHSYCLRVCYSEPKESVVSANYKNPRKQKPTQTNSSLSQCHPSYCSPRARLWTLKSYTKPPVIPSTKSRRKTARFRRPLSCASWISVRRTFVFFA